MKTITITFLFFWLFTFGSLACSAELAPTRVVEPELSGQKKAEFPTDGVAILMGMFSPLHNEVKAIYGEGFILSGQYCLNMSSSLDLLTSIGFINKRGNPYYDDPTFSSGNSSTINIIPMEVNVRQRIALTRNALGVMSRGLYVGTGINYIRAAEKIPGIISAKGGNFGMQIFAGPQIFLRDNVAFEGEAKLLLNQVNMKSNDIRYSITLSGLVIRVGLSWYY